MIEFVIDYVENVRERPVLPSVEPGYLRPLLPDKPPYRREEWAKIMPDIEKYIMPGVSSEAFSVVVVVFVAYQSCRAYGEVWSVQAIQEDTFLRHSRATHCCARVDANEPKAGQPRE